MEIVFGIAIGIFAWVIVEFVFTGFYTVDQNQRAVKTVFGRAERLGDLTTLDDPISESMREDEKERYNYPQVKIIMPGGPYFKWPWEEIHKVSVATYFRDYAEANRGYTDCKANCRLTS